jgi:hypothetical protein
MDLARGARFSLAIENHQHIGYDMTRCTQRARPEGGQYGGASIIECRVAGNQLANGGLGEPNVRLIHRCISGAEVAPAPGMFECMAY